MKRIDDKENGYVLIIEKKDCLNNDSYATKVYKIGCYSQIREANLVLRVEDKHLEVIKTRGLSNYSIQKYEDIYFGRNRIIEGKEIISRFRLLDI